MLQRWRTCQQRSEVSTSEIIGPMVMPAIWKVGTVSRTAVNVATARFIVLDFDGYDGISPKTPAEIDRLIPSLKPTAALVHLAIPAEATPLEIAREILTATVSGNLTPDPASQLISAIGTLCRIEEIDSLRERISGLEKATANNKQPTTKQNPKA